MRPPASSGPGSTAPRRCMPTNLRLGTPCMPGSIPGGSTTRSSTPPTRPAPTRRNRISQGCAGARWAITIESPASTWFGTRGRLPGRRITGATATAYSSAPSSFWSAAMGRRSISAATGNAAAKPPDHSRTRQPTRTPSWIRSTRSAACRFRALLTSLRSSSAVRTSWGSSPRRSMTCTVMSRTDSAAGAVRSTSSTSRASSPGLNQLLGRRTAFGRIVAGSNSGANSRRTASTCSKSARCWPIRFSRSAILPDNSAVAVGTGVTSRPPRRSRRAALSGSSAIAGFRPHRSHRAALPQWALQKGPETGRSSVPGLMDDRFGEWKGGQDLLERLPGHATLLASFAERLSPEPDDAVFEGAQCPVVEDDPVVLTVSSQHLTEPLMLFPNGSVHPARHFLTKDLQFPDHAFRLRLPFDHEPAAPGLAAIVREAQEVEGLRASQPGGLPSLGGEPPERDQSGLALVE